MGLRVPMQRSSEAPYQRLRQHGESGRLRTRRCWLVKKKVVKNGKVVSIFSFRLWRSKRFK
ncbi:hypothetical protein HPP92_013486, partial [Vanilla planifolia]